jgi:hypothetical protein
MDLATLELFAFFSTLGANCILNLHQYAKCPAQLSVCLSVCPLQTWLGKMGIFDIQSQSFDAIFELFLFCFFLQIDSRLVRKVPKLVNRTTHTQTPTSTHLVQFLLNQRLKVWIVRVQLFLRIQLISGAQEIHFDYK